VATLVGVFGFGQLSAFTQLLYLLKGALAGAAIGRSIFPGVGTIVGSLVGAVAGTFGGGYCTNRIVQNVFDSNNYDIIVKKCKKCTAEVKFRKYLGESVQNYCMACRPKLVATWMPHSLSVRYLREDDADVKSDDNLEKWLKFVLNAMAELVSGKSAAAQFCIANDEHSEIPSLLKAELSKSQQHDATYYLAAADNWSKKDVLSLTSLMAGDLSSLWFLLTDEKKVALNKLDVATFFKVIEKVSDGEQTKGHGFQVIGNVSDGQELLWLNPNADDVKRVLPKLDVICTEQGFELLVVDQRRTE
jgi:hypothetical protein